MHAPRLGHPNLGLGIGLRSVHYQHILEHFPNVDWFEIISENYMDSHGRPRYVLEQLAERYDIVMHGVSLSIGSTDRLDFAYLGKLKQLAQSVSARWISDHVCWTGVAGRNSHDLLPIPYTEQTLAHLVERIRAVQDFLERPLVLENPSSYVTFTGSTMPEWEFIARMADETNCGLLLDVNNVYVSSVNHDFDPVEYLRATPFERVVQFHLAGHTNCGTHLIDTHDGEVIDPVWELYRLAHELTGGVSTLLEWDARIPPFPIVHAEVLKARDHMTTALADPQTHLPFREGAGGGSKHWNAPAGARTLPRDPASSNLRNRRSRMNEFPLDLARTQRWMQSVITHPDGIIAGTRSDEARAALDVDDVEHIIRPSQAMTGIERLNVYGNAYYARLLECLRDEYPGLVSAAGQEGFDGFAFGFLQTYPSTSYTLAQLGAQFPRYLEETRPARQDVDAEPDWADFLIDLARLERAYAEVFDAPGSEGARLLQPEDLHAIRPERWAGMRLVPVSCLRLMTFRFPVHEYASAVRRRTEPSPPEAQSTWLAISRRDFIVRRVALSAAQFELLASICEGCALGEAIESAARVAEISIEELAQSFRMWFQDWSAARYFQRVE